MTMILDELVAALAAANLGQVTSETADWRLRAGYLQDAPDRSICLYETGGRAPEPGLAVDYPNFQVRVRGAEDDYAAARVKMQDIYDYLHANREGTTIGIDVVWCYAIQSGPMSLGADENRRPNLVINFRMMRARP